MLTVGLRQHVCERYVLRSAGERVVLLVAYIIVVLCMLETTSILRRASILSTVVAQEVHNLRETRADSEISFSISPAQ